jgi:hypothetical protein
MSSRMSSGTHLQRWIFGLFAAMFALYCDKASLGNSRGHYQEALWNLVLVGAFLIELRPTLRRTRAALIAVSLFGLHCLVMYLKRDAFPLDSSLILFFGALVECVILTVVYLRLCQSIDPQGPFGLTSAEKEARKNRAVHLG